MAHLKNISLDRTKVEFRYIYRNGKKKHPKKKLSNLDIIQKLEQR